MIANKIKRARKVFQRLRRAYPEARCSLHHKNPFHLLIATILSAQCTDTRVNMVVPQLFKRFKLPGDFARANLRQLERLIQSTGFYHNKAINIKNCATQIVKRHGGKVPKQLEALVDLSGVGRKTANVVRGNAFGQAALVVDTHVKRITNRLGWTKIQDPVKIELEMMQIFSRRNWTDFAHVLIAHGRKICIARNPKCSECVVKKFCPSAENRRS